LTDSKHFIPANWVFYVPFFFTPHSSLPYNNLELELFWRILVAFIF
jgi:hypothetical protein